MLGSHVLVPKKTALLSVSPNLVHCDGIHIQLAVVPRLDSLVPFLREARSPTVIIAFYQIALFVGGSRGGRYVST